MESTKNALIKLTDVQIRQQEQIVLKDVNLEIGRNEFVFLTGKTGSGKSSLLKTLYGELPLISGIGEVMGYNLSKLKRKEIPYLRRKMGFVFQDFKLLTDRSVYKNLEFVLQSTGWKNKVDIKQRIQNVLEYVEMDKKGYRLPCELSGGEQQRVAIARALLNHPELILADEPTGNLDPEISQALMELLFSICEQGTSIIMASHDYHLMNKFNARNMRCEDGKLVE